MRTKVFMLQKLLLILSLLIPSASMAMDTGGFYPISKVWAWGEYAGGVVLVQLAQTSQDCPNGFWFQDSANSASSNLLSLALPAYHAGTPVMIYADENSDWSGLAAKECELKLIVLE